MGQLKAAALDNYILGLVNQEKINDKNQEAKPVKVRSNNANSKWLKLTATSGRNPVWYKTIGMISFLEYTNKEAVIFFRVFSGQFAGGKEGVKSGQSKSIAFQDSPGSWYLNNVDKNKTCLLSEFVNSVNSLYREKLIPFEFVELANQFQLVDKSQENVLTFARELWKDIYNNFEKIGKDKLKENQLKAIDRRIKKEINNSKVLKKIQKSKIVIDFETTEIAKNYVKKRFNKYIPGFEKEVNTILNNSINRIFKDPKKATKLVSIVKKAAKVAITVA